MDYTHKYIKYKTKYLNLKSGAFDNITTKDILSLIPIWDERTNIFKEYFDKLDTLDVLEIGVNDARRSIPISELFKNYTGLEPGNTIKKAEELCNKHNCKIKLIKESIDNYKTDSKYDIIIFINVFHFIEDKDNILKECLKMLTKKGILYIEEKKPIPQGWTDSILNKNSKEFDLEEWNKKQAQLNQVKNYLLYDIKNVKYYDLTYKDIYVVSKNK